MEFQKIETQHPQIIISSSQFQQVVQNDILHQQSQKSIIRTQRSLHHISSSNIQNNKSKLIPAGQYVVSYNFQNQSESKFRIHNLLVGFGQQNQSKVNTKNKLKKIKERQSQQNFNDITNNTTNMQSTKPHSFQTNFFYSKSLDKSQTQSKNHLSTFHYKKQPSTVISGSNFIKKVPKISNNNNNYQKENYPSKTLQNFNLINNARQNICSNKMSQNNLKNQKNTKIMNGYINAVQNEDENECFQSENIGQNTNEFHNKNNKNLNTQKQQNDEKLSKYLSESDFDENLQKNMKQKNNQNMYYKNKKTGNQGYYRNQKTDESCSFLIQPEGQQNRRTERQYQNNINSQFEKNINKNPPGISHLNEVNAENSAKNQQTYQKKQSNWNLSSSPINRFDLFNQLRNENKFQSTSSSSSIPKRKLHPLIKRSPEISQNQLNYDKKTNKNCHNLLKEIHQIDSEDQKMQSQKIVNRNDVNKNKGNNNKIQNLENQYNKFDEYQSINKIKKNKFRTNNNQNSKKNLKDKNNLKFQRKDQLFQQNSQQKQFQKELKRRQNMEKNVEQQSYQKNSKAYNDAQKSKRSKNYEQNYRQFLRLKSQQNQKKRQEQQQNQQEPQLKTTRFKSIQQQNAHIQRVINPLQRSFLQDRRKKLSMERQKKRIKSLQESKDGTNQQDFIRGDSLNYKNKKNKKTSNDKIDKKNNNILNEVTQKRNKINDRKVKMNTFNQRNQNDLSINSQDEEFKDHLFKRSAYKEHKPYKRQEKNINNKNLKKKQGQSQNQLDNQKIQGIKVPQQAIKKKNNQKYGSYDNDLNKRSSKNNALSIKQQKTQGRASINKIKKTQNDKDKFQKTKNTTQNIQENNTKVIGNNKKFLSSEKKQAKQKLVNQKQWRQSMKKKREIQKQKNIIARDKQYKNKNWKQSQNNQDKKDFVKQKKDKQGKIKQHKNKQDKDKQQKNKQGKVKQSKEKQNKVKFQRNNQQKKVNQIKQSTKNQKQIKQNSKIVKKFDQNESQKSSVLPLSDEQKNVSEDDQLKNENQSQNINQTQKVTTAQRKEKQINQRSNQNKKESSTQSRQKQNNQSLHQHQKNSIDLQSQILNKTHNNAEQQEQKELINNILNSTQMNQHGIFEVSSSKAIIQHQRFLKQQQKQIKKVYGSNIHIFDEIKQGSQSMVYDNYDRAPILQWIFQLPSEYQLEDKKFKSSFKKHTYFQTYTNNSITTEKNFQHQLKNVIKNQNVFKALQIITNMDQWMLMRIIEPFMTENKQLGIWLYCLGVWRIIFISEKQLNQFLNQSSNREAFKQFSLKSFIWQIIESAIQKVCNQYYKEAILDIELQQFVRMISGLRVTKLKSSNKALKQLAYSHKKHLTIVAIPSESTELSKWNNGYIFITRIQFTPFGQKVYQIKSFRKQDMKIKFYWIKEEKLLHTFSNFLVINKRFASYWTNRTLEIQGNQKGIFCLNAEHTTCGSITVYYDKVQDSKSQLCLYKQIQPEVLKLVGRLSSPKNNMTSYNTNMYFDFSLKGTYYLFLQTPSKANLSIQATSNKLQIQFIQSVKTQTMKNQQCEYVEIDKMFANQKLKKWISQQKKVKIQEIIDL